MAVGIIERRDAAVGERLLTVRELAARLGISTRQAWKLLAAGRLPAPLRLGRSVRWRAATVDRWIAAGCPSREVFEATRASVAGGAK